MSEIITIKHIQEKILDARKLFPVMGLSALLLVGCGQSETTPTPEQTVTPTEHVIPYPPTEVPEDEKMICPPLDSDHPYCL